MNLDLTGRTALVTGASRGLGREIALQLARAGASLALLGRDAAALQETHSLLSLMFAHPGQVFITRNADLRDLAALPGVVAECLDELGTIDLLINNAAMQGGIGTFEALDPREWREVMTVNFLAPVECCRLLLPEMKKRGDGKIVNLSGGGATGPRAHFSAYASSKAALVRFSETLADEAKPFHIDVNCVAPGALNTQMLDELLAAGPEAAPREYQRAQEQWRAGGTPLSKGAELVHFLASPASDGITGRLLSAVWDDWRSLPERLPALAETDLFTLRRIGPRDRGLDWS